MRFQILTNTGETLKITDKTSTTMNNNVIKLELTADTLRAIMKSSPDDVRKQLEKSLGENISLLSEPTLDDYKTIRSYEDACIALGEKQLDVEDLEACGVDAHIIALMKLETISRALWGRNFQPVPQAEWDGETYYWSVWWCYFTEKEVANIKQERNYYGDEVAALFGGSANSGAAAGFGFLVPLNRPAVTGAYFGFRLCQESKEKARYFANTFAELWAEYLAFGFEIKERII